MRASVGETATHRRSSEAGPASRPTAGPSSATPGALRAALSDGTLVERFLSVLMHDDGRRALVRERLTNGQLQQLFELELSQTVRIMLMNAVTDTPWHRALSAAEKEAVQACFQKREDKEDAKDKADKTDNTDKTGRADQATPPPKKTADLPPRPPSKRPVFKARRTGRPALSSTSAELARHLSRLHRSRAASDPLAESVDSPGEPQPAAIASDILSPPPPLPSPAVSSLPLPSTKRARSNERASLDSDTHAPARKRTRPALRISDSKLPSSTSVITIDDTPSPATSEDEPLATSAVDAILRAPSGRLYNHWQTHCVYKPDEHLTGRNDKVLTVVPDTIWPDGYCLTGPLDRPWNCPVLGCHKCMYSETALGQHFLASHSRALLNDNLDGTLSAVRQGLPSQGAARVISQTALSSVLLTLRSRDRSVDRHQMESELLTAPSGREYTVMPEKFREAFKNTSTYGTPIPDGYTQSALPGLPWVCPVRDCQVVFAHASRMGPHFTRKHRNASLNDNGDGTFSEIGWHNASRGIVVSQERRTADELEPLAPPRPPQRNPVPRPATTTTNMETEPQSEPMQTPLPPSTSLTEQPRTVPLAGPAGPPTTSTWEYVRPRLVRHTDAKMPHTGYVPLFASLPRKRALHFNEKWTARNKFRDTLTRDVSSVIMQVTGDYAAQPCEHCSKDRGPYKGCVLVAAGASVDLHAAIGGCANCIYHCGQAYCSHKELLKDRFHKLFPTLSLDAERKRMGLSLKADVPASSRKARQPRPSSPEAEAFEAESAEPETVETPETPETPETAANAATAAFGRRSERIAVRESLEPLVRPRRHQSAEPASTSPRLAPLPVPLTVPVAPMVPVSPVAPVVPVVPVVPVAPVAPAVHTFQAPDGAVDWDPMHALEMEDWEVAPGRIEVQRAVRPGGDVRPEAVAFSNAYLSTTSGQPVRIDHNVSFGVRVVRAGETLVFEPDTGVTRMCSLAAGKLRVRVDDAEFVQGPNSMFVVRPGQRVTVANRLYLDAYLHMFAARNLP